MNQLNDYQDRVVGQIALYADSYVREKNLDGAWKAYWDACGDADRPSAPPFSDNTVMTYCGCSTG